MGIFKIHLHMKELLSAGHMSIWLARSAFAKVKVQIKNRPAVGDTSKGLRLSDSDENEAPGAQK